MEIEKKCPECCSEINSIFHNDLESLCGKCGHVFESFNIQNENNKFIEDKGAAKKMFMNSYNPTYRHLLTIPETNYKRTKKIKDIIQLCEKYIPLHKNDKDDIEAQIEKHLKNSKEICHNLKALVSSAFYIKCNENKRFIKLKDFLKNLNIKNKHFLKYTENLKRTIQQKYVEKDQNDLEEIFEKLFQKLSVFLSTQRFNQKKFDMITSLYKPPSNYSENHRNLFFVKFGESSELMTKIKKLVFTKTKFLFSLQEIQFLKNGKSPVNFISAIIVIILKSFELKLTKNEFSNLFEIPYCTLTRIMKEIEHCLIDKYKIIMQKEISNDKKDKNNINIGENIDREKKNEIIIIEENNLVSKTSLKENKERKILFNFIMNNLQNLEVKQTNIMGKEKENNSFHILLNE